MTADHTRQHIPKEPLSLFSCTWLAWLSGRYPHATSQAWIQASNLKFSIHDLAIFSSGAIRVAFFKVGGMTTLTKALIHLSQ